MVDLRRGRRAQGPRLTLKVHAAVASARKSVLGRMAPHPGLEPCLPRRPNSGLIFSLHGMQTCTKQRREHTRPIFLQGGGFFLTPGCPSVFRCQEPSLGRCWGSGLCRSLTPSGASARSWASGVFLLQCSEMAGSVLHRAVGLSSGFSFPL